MSELRYLGNKDLLKLPKTAFLASNTIPSETVLRCYDWATEMRNQGKCVISGFSSKLERDVLHFLLKGKKRRQRRLVLYAGQAFAPGKKRTEGHSTSV